MQRRVFRPAASGPLTAVLKTRRYMLGDEDGATGVARLPSQRGEAAG